MKLFYILISFTSVAIGSTTDSLEEGHQLKTNLISQDSCREIESTPLKSTESTPPENANSVSCPKDLDLIAQLVGRL